MTNKEMALSRDFQYNPKKGYIVINKNDKIQSGAITENITHENNDHMIAIHEGKKYYKKNKKNDQNILDNEEVQDADK